MEDSVPVLLVILAAYRIKNSACGGYVVFQYYASSQWSICMVIFICGGFCRVFVPITSYIHGIYFINGGVYSYQYLVMYIMYNTTPIKVDRYIKDRFDDVE